MVLVMPSPIRRIIGIRLNHAKHVYVKSVRNTVIKAVPITRRLVALAGKSSHVLGAILPASAGIKRLQEFQQLLSGDKGLIRPPPVPERVINGCERKSRTGAWVRRIAEIEQIAPPRILSLAVVVLESRAGEVGA
jgi:hypothetical protein